MRKPRAVLFSLLVVACGSIADCSTNNGASAEREYRRGLDAVIAHREKEGKVAIWRAAEMGYPAAQAMVGQWYFLGVYDTPKDYAAALTWYRRAADQGHAESQYRIGSLYEAGQGVAKSDAEAEKWYRAAAEKGFAEAQSTLGSIYFNRTIHASILKKHAPPERESDPADALKWLSLAADQGERQSQYLLGSLYLYGEGVPKEYIKAHMWFNIAATSRWAGDEQDQYRKNAEKERDEIAAKMSPEQLAAAERLALAWKPKEGTGK